MTARAVSEWQAVAGGVRADGSAVTMPAELQRARVVDAWCQRYSCLPWPGSLMEQPAIPFLRWQNVLASVEQSAAARVEAPGFADIPMVAL